MTATLLCLLLLCGYALDCWIIRTYQQGGRPNDRRDTRQSQAVSAASSAGILGAIPDSKGQIGGCCCAPEPARVAVLERCDTGRQA